MPWSYTIAEGKRISQAGYGEPSFALLHDATALMAELFARLAPLGLHPREMRPEPGDGSIGDAHLLCRLPRLDIEVRFYVHQVEVFQTVGRPSIPGDALERVTAEVMRALKTSVPGVTFTSYSATTSLHGQLTPASLREFLAQFVKEAPTLGPLNGTGVVFYYGPSGEALWSSLTLEESAVSNGGLFLSSRVSWDPGRVDADRFGSRATQHVQTVLEHLGLTLGEA